MPPQLCISMPEQEWNFVRLMLARKTYGMYKKNANKVKVLDSYIHGHFSFLQDCKFRSFGDHGEEQTSTEYQSTMSHEN